MMPGRIKVSDIISDFRRMLSERWPYVGGGSSKDGVDCSGAFAWAYRQHGCSIYHGSNRMAREEVVALIPIGQATVVPGMAAFKSRKPSDPKYDLPSSYRGGGYNYNGDLDDYYHVGLVDEDTARVLNAQEPSTGFVASPIGKGWTHVGYLKQVDYGVSDPASSEQTSASKTDKQPDSTYSSTAVTVAASGSTVNLRKSASKSAALVDRIPLGQTVTMRGPEVGGWVPVRWGKKEGWVMAEFLRVDNPGTTPGTQEPEGGTEDIYSSYAVIFYDLTMAQAEALMADNSGYRSTMEERHG